jgi:hypothetical protein
LYFAVSVGSLSHGQLFHVSVFSIDLIKEKTIKVKNFTEVITFLMNDAKKGQSFQRYKDFFLTYVSPFKNLNYRQKVRYLQ